MNEIREGYVKTKSGQIMLQVADDNEWGFSIQDDDQTYPGGLDVGEWELLADDDPRITPADRERLAWILKD